MEQQKIVDTLCPSFSVSGNPVTCNPVEDYPLSAVVSLKPKQAGSGDPSPDNIRPISGWDEATVNTRGKNLCQFGTVTFTGVYRGTNAMLMTVYPPGTYKISADIVSPEASKAMAVLWNYTENTNASAFLQLTANSGRVSGTFLTKKPLTR